MLYPLSYEGGKCKPAGQRTICGVLTIFSCGRVRGPSVY